jgi:predicted ATPase
VTFLFTDLEGSTRLLSEVGAAAYRGVLAEHRGLVRAAVAAHHGVEVDTQGDAFFVAFARAGDALSAAAAITAHGDGGPMRVRVGLHTGEPLLLEQGYVGIDVHRAARIAAAGHGGQVLVSQPTRDLLPELRLRDLGEHRLKDLARPERLFQLGEGEFPPLRSLYRTNLPVPSWPLIGREHELAAIEQMVESGRRLLTLTGAGGSGKTRLAVQAAAELADSFPGGVFFVALAPLQRADAVPGAVTGALGLRADAELVEALQAGRTLLVLDNAEHLHGLEQFVAELVGRAASVVVIVTSRAPLHLAAEAEFPVDPLASVAACELFVARAAATGRPLAVDDVVRAVCARVDYLPLAVELAAARTKTLSPAALLERLEHTLPLLTGGPRDAPERQQTLHATIEWSYQLLDADAKALFRRLAVFRGGFTLAAAEQVAAADLDQVALLVDHSLLKASSDDRFLMLETLREFALDQLAPVELAACRNAHARYYVGLAQLEGPRFRGSDEHETRAALQQELPNLRAALDWLQETNEAELLAELVIALGVHFWTVLGLLREGERYATAALELAEQLPATTRLELLGFAYWFRFSLGNWDEAAQLDEQQLALARSVGDPKMLCGVLITSSSGHVTGDLEQTRALQREGLALARQLGDEPTQPFLFTALHNLSLTESLRGDHAAAEELNLEALELARLHWLRGRAAHSLYNLGQIRVYQRRLDDAEACFREALPDLLPWSRQIFAWALLGMAHLAWHHGDTVRAARLRARAEALHREIAYIPAPIYHAVYEDSANALHQARTDPEIAAAWEQGESMTVEEALDYALETEPHPANVGHE